MKLNKLYIIGFLISACLSLASCNDDSIDGLSGEYDMNRYQFTSCENLPTDKLGKGVKALNFTLSDGNHTGKIKVASSEWILPSGTYNVEPEVKTNGTMSVSFDGVDMYEGKMDVSIVGDVYLLNGLFKDATGKSYLLNYKGAMDFVVGIDDVEPGNEWIYVYESEVKDANGWVVENLTKYSVWVNDAEGNNLLMVDLINRPGLTFDELIGQYSFQSYPGEAWLADVGWVWGEWNGGSFFVDSDNTKQFILEGKIDVTSALATNGQRVYSFNGANLLTILADGKNSSGSFSIAYANLFVDPSKGRLEKDQTIESVVLGKTMKYSVYLPKSYDGDKSFPVLYLLHGMDGDNNSWIADGDIDGVADETIKSGTAPEMIIIMPEANNSFYCNGFNAGVNYMTYFFDEFLPAIESKYKIIADRSHRAVAGLSMGGYGAMYYGALHPEMFSCVYSCSPSPYVTGGPSIIEILGNGDKNNLPNITIEIGTEDSLIGDVNRFEEELNTIGVAHELITRNGYHNWDFWKSCASKILSKFGATIL